MIKALKLGLGGIFRISLITTISLLNCSAQADLSPNRLELLGGFGNYESFHAGVHLSLRQKYFLEGAVGLSPWSFTDDYYLMEYMCFGFPLKKTRSQPVDLFLQWKLVHWDFDDEDTRMSVLTTGPEVKVTYRISARVVLAGNAGAGYNMVLDYMRKNTEEVGWIDRFGPSFSLQCRYFIK